jgi:hypothetical protein
MILQRRLASLAVGLCLWSSALPARAVDDLGVRLPASARKVGDHKYECARGFDDVEKYFREEYKSSRVIRVGREVVVGQTRYIHIDNQSGKGPWSGVNVYQIKNGAVRVTILPVVPAGNPTMPTKP